MSLSRIKELSKHAVIYGIGSVAQSALGFILLPVLTSKMSEAEFGAYSLIFVSVTIASAIFFLGMTSALPRSYFDYPEDQERRSIFTTGLVILISGAMLQIALGYFAGALIAKALLHSNDKIYITGIFWGFFGGALSFIVQYFFSYLRLNRLSISSVIFSLASVVLGVLLTLTFLNNGEDTLIAPFKAIAYTQIIMGILFLLIYGKRALSIQIKLSEAKPLVKFGIGTIFTSFGVMALDWADRFIIEGYTNLSDVGSYSAASRVSGIMAVLLVTPFAQIWSPMMHEYRSNVHIKRFTENVFSLYIMAGGVLVAFISLFATEILSYMIKFPIDQRMIFVFMILSVATIANGTNNIVVAGIFYERKIFLLPIIYYAFAIIKFGLNLFLIPIFGVMAAAFNTLIISIFLPWAVYVVSCKFFKFKIEINRLSKFIPIIIVPIFIGIAFPIQGNPYIHIAARLLLLCLIIVALLFFCLLPDEKHRLKIFLKTIRG